MLVVVWAEGLALPGDVRVDLAAAALERPRGTRHNSAGAPWAGDWLKKRR